jgi:hypothetical protein
MKMVVFWVVAPCSLVEDYRRFRGATSIIRAIILIMETARRTSETLVNFYQTTRRNNPQDSHLKNVCVCTQWIKIFYSDINNVGASPHMHHLRTVIYFPNYLHGILLA